MGICVIVDYYVVDWCICCDVIVCDGELFDYCGFVIGSYEFEKI